MKQQSIGIVLCALLLTTFGHDILNRHQLAHSARLTHPARSEHSRARPSLSSRALDKNSTLTVCTGGSNSSPVFGVYNNSARTGLNIDVKAKLILLVLTNLAILINYENAAIVSLDLGNNSQSNEFPLGAQINISLGSLFERGQNISKEEAGKFIRRCLILLTEGKHTASDLEPFQDLLTICLSLSVSLKTVVSVIETGIITVNVDLIRIVEIINGLAYLVTHLVGGVDALLKLNIKLNLKVMLDLKTTLDISGHIFEQMKGADLVNIFVGLNTTVGVLQLLAGLAGNTIVGVDGLITLLAKLVLCIDGKISLKIFVDVLVEFLAKNKGNANLVVDLKAAVDSLINLITKLGLQVRLDVVLKLLVAIRDDKCVENGVNISVIIKLIGEGLIGDLLKLVIQILKSLEAIISIEICIATLLWHLIELLTVRGGARILTVVVGISINLDILNDVTNALRMILRGIGLDLLLTLRGLAGTLIHIDLLRDIVVAIDVQLKVLGINVTVRAALGNSSTKGIVNIIIDILRGAAATPMERVKPLGPSRRIQPTSSPNQRESIEGSSENGCDCEKEEIETGGGKGREHSHLGKSNISGLSGAHGQDRNDHNRGQDKHAPHEKFHHAQEKHHEAHGKHHHEQGKHHHGQGKHHSDDK